MPHFPDPVDTSSVSLPADYLRLAEALAHNDHCRWGNALAKLGWQYGPRFDPVQQTHPHLVTFEALPEDVKSGKLKLFLDNFKVVMALGYRIDVETEGGAGKGVAKPPRPCKSPN
jgi:hypothetical protein